MWDFTVSEALIELESAKDHKEMYEESFKQTRKKKSKEISSLKQQINSLEGKVKEVENKQKDT